MKAFDLILDILKGYFRRAQGDRSIVLKTRKSRTFVRDFYVVPPGIEPGTHGFSVHCSTN